MTSKGSGSAAASTGNVSATGGSGGDIKSPQSLKQHHRTAATAAATTASQAGAGNGHSTATPSASASASASASGSGQHKTERDRKDSGNGHTTNGHTNSSSKQLVNTAAAAAPQRITLPATITTPAGHTLPAPAMVRLMIQSLHALGCRDAATRLEQETGLSAEDSAIGLFRARVLAGDWTAAERLLPQLQISDTSITLPPPPPAPAATTSSIDSLALVPAAMASSSAAASTANPPTTTAINQVLLMIREQKFLELLEAGKVGDAVLCLRSELAPLATASAGDTVKLHKLSSFVLYAKPEDIRTHAQWDGAAGKSRAKLLDSILAVVPPTLALPTNRLFTLIDYAIAHQQSLSAAGALVPAASSAAPSASEEFSLLQDSPMMQLAAGGSALAPIRSYSASAPRPPAVVTLGAIECVCSIDAHTDEVLHAACAHDGLRFATASKDRTAVVWVCDAHTSQITVERILRHGLGGARNSNTSPAIGGASSSLSQASSSQSSSSGGSASDSSSSGGGAVSAAGGVGSGSGSVSFVAWSSDDRYLLTLSDPNTVSVWSTATGECVLVLSDKHLEVCTATAWLNGGGGVGNDAQYTFLTAGIDKRIVCWDLKGTQLRSWSSEMVRDLHVIQPTATAASVATTTAAARRSSYRIVTTDMKNRIRVITTDGNPRASALPASTSGDSEIVLSETGPITSLAVSRSGQFALVTIKGVPPSGKPSRSNAPDPAPSSSGSGGSSAASASASASAKPSKAAAVIASTPHINLWDLTRGERVATFSGFQQSRYVVRCAFAGPDDAFVVSGSEDSQVYVWNRLAATTAAASASTAAAATATLSASTASSTAMSDDGDSKRDSKRSSADSTSSSTAGPTVSHAATAILAGHTAPVNAIAVFPMTHRGLSARASGSGSGNGSRIVMLTASDDCTVRVWGSPTLKALLPPSLSVPIPSSTAASAAASPPPLPASSPPPLPTPPTPMP